MPLFRRVCKQWYKRLSEKVFLHLWENRWCVVDNDSYHGRVKSMKYVVFSETPLRKTWFGKLRELRPREFRLPYSGIDCATWSDRIRIWRNGRVWKHMRTVEKDCLTFYLLDTHNAHSGPVGPVYVCSRRGPFLQKKRDVWLPADHNPGRTYVFADGSFYFSPVETLAHTTTNTNTTTKRVKLRLMSHPVATHHNFIRATQSPTFQQILQAMAERFRSIWWGGQNYLW